jgi:hypothetical protein
MERSQVGCDAQTNIYACISNLRYSTVSVELPNRICQNMPLQSSWSTVIHVACMQGSLRRLMIILGAEDPLLNLTDRQKKPDLLGKGSAKANLHAAEAQGVVGSLNRDFLVLRDAAQVSWRRNVSFCTTVPHRLRAFQNFTVDFGIPNRRNLCDKTLASFEIFSAASPEKAIAHCL